MQRIGDGTFCADELWPDVICWVNVKNEKRREIVFHFTRQ